MNLLGKRIDDKQSLYQGLRKIKGLNKQTIEDILSCHGIGSDTKISELLREEHSSETISLLTTTLMIGIVERVDSTSRMKQKQSLDTHLLSILSKVRETALHANVSSKANAGNSKMYNANACKANYISSPAIKNFMLESGLVKYMEYTATKNKWHKRRA